MNRAAAAVLSLIFCLALGALRTADLLFWSGPATGFVLAGQAWYRYAAAAAAAAVLFALSRAASKTPRALARPRRALGLAMLLAAALLLETGLSTCLALWQDGFAALRGVLLLVSGLWFAAFGVRAMWAPSRRPAPAALGLPVLAAPVWVAIERFAVRPSSLARTGHILQVLSILAVLCFLASLLKAFFLPGAPYGQGLAFTGMLAFLFGSCIELPQTVVAFLHDPDFVLVDLALSACWGAVGLCGLVCALYAAGRDRLEQAPQ